MSKPIIGFFTVTETREEFYKKRKSIVMEEVNKFKKKFKYDFNLLISKPIRDFNSALFWAEEAKKKRVDCIIIHIPIWAPPNLTTKIASTVDVPLLILGNNRLDSSSLVGIFGAAGAIGQIGKKAKRLMGDFEDEEIKNQIISFIKACQAINELKNSNYCIFGGRSLGMGTTIADFAQWQKIFGIECDHKDQYEIVKRAEGINDDRTKLYLDWLLQNVGKINFGGLFTIESLKKQINSYLALKDIVKEAHYNFLSIKCQPELSNNYVTQCLAISLLNDNYDVEGKKDPVPCACEADNDGALTMKILSIVAGGAPSNLMDIRLLKPKSKELVFTNCGGMPIYFAGHSKNSLKNMKNVHMMENIFGKAGGGTIQFVVSNGPVTLARMFRLNGEYIMGIIEGKFKEKPRDDLKKTTYCWPHGFVKANINFDKFFNTMGANHMHAVYGYHRMALENFCEILDIKHINYNSK